MKRGESYVRLHHPLTPHTTLLAAALPDEKYLEETLRHDYHIVVL